MKLPQSLDKSRTALVIIDMQNDYCSEDGFFATVLHEDVKSTQRMIPRLRKVLEDARKIRLPVIFVRTLHDTYTASETYKARMGGKSPNFCRPNTWGAEIVAKLKPKRNEIVVTKHRYSAFVDSPFPLVIRSMDIQNLLFTGAATNVCVESTLRDALMYDYFPVLLSDCVSAYDQTLHDGSLKNISKYFGAVASSQEVFERIS